jgi:hypothetical protein
MYSFVVLGIIPGTNLQITLKIWLDSLAFLVAVAGMIWLTREHQQRRLEPIEVSLRPAPLPARQLHLRG